VDDPNSNRLLTESNFFARFEPYGFSRRNRDFGSRPGISSYATLAGLDYKDSKSSKLDALTMLHSLFECAENRVNGNLGFDLGHAHLFGHTANNILLNHRLAFPP